MSARVYNNSVIGSKTQIGDKCEVSDSVIGESCDFGKNVKIENSIIEKNVIIESDCVISNAIIQSGSYVKSGSTISQGSIVTNNVVIKANVVIPPSSVCSLLAYDNDEKKFVPIEADKFNQEYFEKGSFSYIPRDLALRDSELIGAGNPFEDEEESGLDTGIPEDPPDQEEIAYEETEGLYKDCIQTQEVNKRGQEEFIRNLVSEFKSAKMTNNISNTSFTYIVFNVIMSHTFGKESLSEVKKEGLTMAELVAEITSTLEFHFGLFETFCGDAELRLRLIGEAEYFSAEHDKINFITLA